MKILQILQDSVSIPSDWDHAEVLAHANHGAGSFSVLLAKPAGTIEEGLLVSNGALVDIRNFPISLAEYVAVSEGMRPIHRWSPVRIGLKGVLQYYTIAKDWKSATVFAVGKHRDYHTTVMAVLPAEPDAPNVYTDHWGNKFRFVIQEIATTKQAYLYTQMAHRCSNHAFVIPTNQQAVYVAKSMIEGVGFTTLGVSKLLRFPYSGRIVFARKVALHQGNHEKMCHIVTVMADTPIVMSDKPMDYKNPLDFYPFSTYTQVFSKRAWKSSLIYLSDKYGHGLPPQM